MRGPFRVYESYEYLVLDSEETEVCSSSTFEIAEYICSSLNMAYWTAYNAEVAKQLKLL
jgi:hypothetical protein